MSGYYDVDPAMTENWTLDTDELVKHMREQAESRNYWKWSRIHVDLSGKDSDLTDYGYRGIEILGADGQNVRIMIHALWSIPDDDEHEDATDTLAEIATVAWIIDESGTVRYDDTAAAILELTESRIDHYAGVLS